MKKSIFAALLLIAISCQLSAVSTEKVVRLEPLTGTEVEYPVADLLRVEFSGDSIRFIAQDGSITAEVYKYDYAKLTIAVKEPKAIESLSLQVKPGEATKVLIDGQVYILLGDKAYRIDGTEVR